MLDLICDLKSLNYLSSTPHPESAICNLKSLNPLIPHHLGSLNQHRWFAGLAVVNAANMEGLLP
jgi:hypothetical protein